MAYVDLNKRNLLAVLAGLLVIILVAAINQLVNFAITTHLFRILSFDELKTGIMPQPFVTITAISKIISFFTLPIGGFVVGKTVKEKGWLYAALLGLALCFLLISISIIPLFLPKIKQYDYAPNYSQIIIVNNIKRQLLNSPEIILLTLTGGTLGMLLRKNKLKKKQ